MKKYHYLPFLLLWFVQDVHAQIANGNIIISGNSSLSYLSTVINGNAESEVDIIVSPYIGVFVSDRMLLGGALNLANNAGNEGTIGIQANARYYFEPQVNKAWFLGANLGIVRLDGESSYFGDFGLGLDLFLSPFLSVESNLSVGFTKDQNEFVGGITTYVQMGTSLKFFLNYQEELGVETQNWALKEGSIFLGVSSGNILFSKRSSSTNYNIDLSPKIGFFLKDNLLLASNFTFNVSKFDVNDFTVLRVELSPFVRYYHAATNPQLALFVEGGGGIQLTDITGSAIDFEVQKSPLFFGGLGFNYFIRPMVALEIKGSYQFTSLRENVKLKRTGLDIGFQFFLAKKSK